MTRRKKPVREGLQVTLFGVVHQPECPSMPGMTWAWEGRNNLNGDRPCLECLPKGLPVSAEPHKFSGDEIATLRKALADSEADQ